MRDSNERIFGFDRPLDHKLLTEAMQKLVERYEFAEFGKLGQSIMGRSIDILRFGKGKKSVMYIGAHHGMEWITSALLLRFTIELFELYRIGGSACGIPIKNFFEDRCIYIIPMLNPDGVDYVINGVGKDNVMYDRLIAMNGGSDDFSHWQANARGVDLNHNYNAGFSEYKKIEPKIGITGGGPTKYSGEGAESEPEVAYLCNFLRFSGPPSLVLTFHTQGEEIYFTSLGEVLPENERLGKKIASVSGYKLSYPEGSASYGGFTDWFIKEFGGYSYTVECGKGENPLPASDLPMIYATLRRMMFEAPFYI